MADRLPTKDEAIARLEAFQVRLDEAKKLGRAAYDQLFDAAPAGSPSTRSTRAGTSRGSMRGSSRSSAAAWTS